jgi:hypothetical protein
MKGSYRNSIFLSPTNEQEIKAIIQSFPSKSSYGFDEVSMNLLKKTSLNILNPLTKIINLSLSTGVVPSKIKISKVCPIYKEGPEDVFGNYRPISLLTSFSKVFERIVFTRLNTYLIQNNILISSQYGFRTSYSTEMAIHDFYHKISDGIDDNNYVIGLFVDLKKAFDTVNHKVLLTKLNHYGIRGVALQWIENYLSNRQQYVSLNKTISDLKTVRCGVPQGSILGPLLFIIYINDIVNCSKLLYMILYADDTNIIYTHKDLNTLITTVNCELNKLSSWFSANRLTLN